MWPLTAQPPVDMKKIVSGGRNGLELYFYLEPVLDARWAEAFERAAAQEVAHAEDRPRLAVSGSPPQYVVAWPGAPQDVGLAVEAIDRFMDEANARSQGTGNGVR